MGANSGDAPANLGAAVRELRGVVHALKVAPLYRTEARFPARQSAAYFNTAVTGETELSPPELLAFLKLLELYAGRRSAPRGADRPLDVDLLLYGDLTSAHPELRLPHPRLRERRFVLAPLADLVPELRLPPDGTTVAQALAQVGQEDEVKKIGKVR